MAVGHRPYPQPIWAAMSGPKARLMMRVATVAYRISVFVEKLRRINVPITIRDGDPDCDANYMVKIYLIGYMIRTNLYNFVGGAF